MWIVFIIIGIGVLIYSFSLNSEVEECKRKKEENASMRYSLNFEEKKAYERYEREYDNISNTQTAFQLAFIVCLVLALFTSCSSDPKANIRDTNTCGYCENVYRSGDSGGNYMNIARTGLCKKCYTTYKSAQEALDFINDNR